MNATPQQAPVRRRRRDRKLQILGAAASLFHRNGYDAVSMTGIAASVGITPGALYRHYGGKNDILIGCIETRLDAVEAALAATECAGLDAALAALARMPEGTSSLGELWGRDLLRLPATEQAALRQRMTTIARRLAGLLSSSRPELSAADVDLLSWAVSSVFASASYYRVDLPPERVHAMFTRLASAAAYCTQISSASTPEYRSAGSEEGRVGVPRYSRRERLLTEASRMFDERGYIAVSMEDIGATAGISSALVYRHFDSKADLLFTASLRVVDNLELQMADAFSDALSPVDALRRLGRSYIELAVRHRPSMSNLVTAVSNLPPEQRGLLRVRQRDYLDEWTRLLTNIYTTASYGEARTALHAALTVVHNTLRTPHLRTRPTLLGDLEQLMMTIFAASGHDRASPVALT
ncbi:TetR/AcrR family transcriptional regulator [Nocardia gipuzkoensis]|uniref:TetR/AcrR family transcriptional regulator n=1 Tax=Nocardia gipuzkoensis TaxID=2749991 RepID=UPI00237E7CEF|nr:TetR/AcrR family transcriptional regulator [Nocardia gipuzkoensis]MDE1675262.1 TetR/AcrR family transcriptional regulator [Nocardia gipuzkoensis]